MSRAPAHHPVVIKPSTNIYTVLLIVATIVVLLGLIVLFVTAGSLFPPNGLF
jgi:hypothetical protein